MILEQKNKYLPSRNRRFYQIEQRIMMISFDHNSLINDIRILCEGKLSEKKKNIIKFNVYLINERYLDIGENYLIDIVNNKCINYNYKMNDMLIISDDNQDIITQEGEPISRKKLFENIYNLGELKTIRNFYIFKDLGK